MANVLKGTATGAGIGATIGSVIPGIGNALGTFAGAVYGTLVSVVGNIFGVGKAKKKIGVLQNSANTLIQQENAQSKTITYLILGVVGLVILAFFVFFIKRKR